MSEEIIAKPEQAAWFATTHWSVVLAAQEGDSEQARTALEALCRTYWYPLYGYVRRLGYDEESAKDLIQEFFCRLIEKSYLEAVKREKGRFRSFLLASLKHFLNVARVRESAIKRGGRQTFVPLEDGNIDDRYLAEPASTLPEAVYDRGWAMTLMERALNILAEEFQRDGKADQFEQLKPFLSREPAEGEYARVASSAGLTPGAFSVAVHRLRQSYGQRVRREVADTVAHPAEIEEELRYLFAVLTSA